MVAHVGSLRTEARDQIIEAAISILRG